MVAPVVRGLVGEKALEQKEGGGRFLKLRGREGVGSIKHGMENMRLRRHTTAAAVTIAAATASTAAAAAATTFAVNRTNSLLKSRS